MNVAALGAVCNEPTEINVGSALVRGAQIIKALGEIANYNVEFNFPHNL